MELAKLTMANSTMLVLKEAQNACAGIAQSMGLDNEDDVVALVKAHRRTKKAQK
ncbi:MAG: hypothetical protein LBP28_04160 [Coriobacteriales bacterium]|jgi:hypothetical protein|nr:hypothetical protein [Coriobacteriales bacterium]